jgi:hypothetical protein
VKPGDMADWNPVTTEIRPEPKNREPTTASTPASAGSTRREALALIAYRPLPQSGLAGGFNEVGV